MGWTMFLKLGDSTFLEWTMLLTGYSSGTGPRNQLSRVQARLIFQGSIDLIVVFMQMELFYSRI